MPRRKSLTIEERNALEREAIQAGKAYSYTGPALTGFVEGYMDRELHYRNPLPKPRVAKADPKTHAVPSVGTTARSSNAD